MGDVSMYLMEDPVYTYQRFWDILLIHQIHPNEKQVVCRKLQLKKTAIAHVVLRDWSEYKSMFLTACQI